MKIKISEQVVFLKNIVKCNGWGELLRLVARRFYRKVDFYIYTRELSTLDNPVAFKELTIKLADPGELEKLRSNPENFSIELYWDIVYKVRRSYLGYINDRFIHISWVYFRQDGNKYFPLNDEEAMIGPCLTLHSARGKGVYTKVINFICHRLKESGIKKVYMVVEKSNLASIKGIEKAGLRKYGEIIMISILFLTRKKRHLLMNE